MSDDLETLREAFSKLSETAKPRDDCPAPEELFAAVKLELPPRRRHAIVDHLSSCASCAEDWRLATQMSPVVVDESVERPTFLEILGAFWRNRSLVGAVAAVLAFVAVGVYLTHEPSEPGYRVPEGIVIRSLVPEDTPLSRDRCVLRWTAGPVGARYDVRVTTEGLEPVTSANGLEENELRISEELLASLPPDSTILWQVVMHQPEGTEKRSETFLSQIE